MSMFSKFSKNKEKHSYSFSFDKSINALSNDLLNKVSWKVSYDTSPNNALFNSWHKISGAHKWHHYFPIYEKVFNELVNRPIKVLEIGVAQGASIKMWREFFNSETKIVGIDIHPSCVQFENKNDNVFIRIGSQADEAFLNRIVEEFGKFDIIIDDGSHMTSHMIDSFNYLFLNGLKERGIYLAEDTHSNYWLSHRDTAISFIDLAKSLVDIMHYHYTIGTQEYDFRLNSDSRLKEFDVPRITTLIEEIRFFDSIIVLYKTNLIVPVSEYI